MQSLYLLTLKEKKNDIERKFSITATTIVGLNQENKGNACIHYTSSKACFLYYFFVDFGA